MSSFGLTVIGDSFAEGWGDPAPDGGLRGWVSRFAELVNLPARTVRNLGVYGATSEHAVDQQLPRAMAAKSPLISVIIGVNDMLQRDYNFIGLRQNLETIFGILSGQDTTLVTVTYPDIPGQLEIRESKRTVLQERFAEGNATLLAVAKKTGAYVVDLRGAMDSDPAMWFEDNLHPSWVAHQYFAEQMAETAAWTTGLIAA
jgi:lysophospholipase L1-like esterase